MDSAETGVLRLLTSIWRLELGQAPDQCYALGNTIGGKPWRT